MPRYVTVDLFGKVGVGKTTIFELFAGDTLLGEGGNLSYDFRGYYAKCWILPRRWNHTMVFLADPKLEWRWKDLNVRLLRKLFEPTNVLLIVSDSTLEDVLNIKKSFSVFPNIKRKLIIYVIANMQDLDDRLSPEEIKEILEIKDVLGVSAIKPGAKELIEPFIEDAVKRYFLMLSKRGEALELVDADYNPYIEHNNTGKNEDNTEGSAESEIKSEIQEKRKLRTERLREISKKIKELENLMDNRSKAEEEERRRRILEHKAKLKEISKKLGDV